MRLAARGLRDMGAGSSAINDAAERAAVRRQARRVQVRAIAGAATLLFAYVLLTELL